MRIFLLATSVMAGCTSPTYFEDKIYNTYSTWQEKPQDINWIEVEDITGFKAPLSYWTEGKKAILITNVASK